MKEKRHERERDTGRINLEKEGEKVCKGKDG